MGRTNKTDERSLRRQEPIPQITLPGGGGDEPEPSLAVTQPHVAPAQPTKQKPKRTSSSSAIKKRDKAKTKAIERAGKLDQRKGQVEGKREKRKRDKRMWD